MRTSVKQVRTKHGVEAARIVYVPNERSVGYRLPRPGEESGRSPGTRQTPA